MTNKAEGEMLDHEAATKGIVKVQMDEKKWTKEVAEYCETTEPTNIYLAFKKDVGKTLIIQTKYPIPVENIMVMIDDINKDWQSPLFGISFVGNPKIKIMNQEDFEKTFEILSYAVQVRDSILMDTINNIYGYNQQPGWKHDGKLKRFHHYQ